MTRMKMNKDIARGIGGALTLVTLLTPSVAFAAGGDSEIVKTAIFHLINLVALLAIVIYFVRKPMARFLQDRKSKVTSELEEARKLHEEAKALLEEYGTQIANLNEECASILREYKKMGVAEREKIIAAAKRQAEKIALDAESTMATEIARAKEELETEVLRLATEMAESAMKEMLNTSVQTKLIDDYINNLEGALRN
jgi:F-type H+-transporting ATPase subunit b